MKKMFYRWFCRIMRMVYYWDNCPLDYRKDFKGIFFYGLSCMAFSIFICLIFAALILFAL